MARVSAFYQDPFSPKLFSSVPLAVTDEQKNLVKRVLDVSSSDTRFSDKAYAAITYILTAKPTPLPVVTSLNPGSATLGDPSFTLHVVGTGFDATSQIVWNGGTEPTTYVSATELTTGVDMSTAQVAMSIPVGVVTSDGVQSNNLLFVLQPAAVTMKAKSVEVKPVVHEMKK